MQARHFSRKKKSIKNSILVLFGTVILFCFSVFLSEKNFTVHAQPQPTDYYRVFETLFSEQDGKKIFDRTGWITNQSSNSIDGVTFTFISKFAVDSSLPEVWFWEHVINIEYEQKNAFLVRFCPQNNGIIDETNCLFSRVPYKKIAPSDSTFLDAIYIYTSSRRTIGATALPLPIPIVLPTPGTVYGPLTNAFGVNFEAKTFFKQSELTLENAPATNTLTKGQAYQADMWYCPGRPSRNSTPPPIEEEGRSIPVGKETIKNFGKICNEQTRGYFRIGSPLVFIVPSTLQEAANDPTAGTQAVSQDTYNQADPSASVLPVCAWFGIGNGSFNGCIAKGVYFLIFKPIAWFAGLMGNLFDFFLGYSLDDASYRLDFAVNGWKLVRDIANIFFIIILVYTGFAAVFDIGSISMKKVVPALIINAFIINFSLFATRIVIDVSNIFARILYNTMNVTSVVNGKSTVINAEGPGGYRPISEQIVSSFNPQKLFRVQYLSPQEQIIKKNNEEADLQADEDSLIGRLPSDEDKKGSYFDRNTRNYANFFIIVSVISAAILFSMAKMFWKVAFLFLGRVIGLYIAMIFSPFAFLTRGGIPLVGNIQQIKWSDWLRDLTNYAVLAPIFLLFLYVIYAFSTSDFVKSFNAFPNQDNGFFGTILTITIPLLIIYTFISYGVTLAKKYSGTIGETVQDWASKATGFVGGAALGATALVGSRVIGGAARSADQSRIGVGIRNLAARGGIAGWAGKTLQRGLNRAQSGSFDARQTGLGTSLFKSMGVDTNPKGLDALRNVPILGAIGPGLSTDQRKGGIDAAIKRRQEKEEEDSKLFEEKMDIGAYNARKNKQYERVKKALEQRIDKELLAGGMTKGDLETLKKNDVEYSKKKIDVIAKTKDQGILMRAALVQKGPQELKDSDSMTADRRKTFVENLKKGSLSARAFDYLANKNELGEAVATTLGVAVGVAAGNLIGQQITTAGERKAAKKIGERAKVEKEIAEVKGAVEKGFKELVAIEMFQSSTSFTKLDPSQKQKILKGEESMFNILEDKEKAAVETRIFSLSDKEKEKYYDSISNRFSARQSDLKELNKKIKAKEKEWQEADDRSRVGLFDELNTLLKEKDESIRMKKKYDDYKEFIRKEKEKLKGDDKK